MKAIIELESGVLPGWKYTRSRHGPPANQPIA